MVGGRPSVTPGIDTSLGSLILTFTLTSVSLSASSRTLSDDDPCTPDSRFSLVPTTFPSISCPLYIEETDVDGKEALATVPLVSYTSSFVAALLLKYINKSCGTKICYLLGTLIGILSGVVTEYGGNSAIIIYVVAILIGSGSSITMITALSVTAEIIGPRTERSAIVYSIVTFLDKVVTGLVVIFIEKWRCMEPELCPSYNRDTLALVCVLSMSIGLVTLLSISRCLG